MSGPAFTPNLNPEALPELYEALLFASAQLDELINRHYGGEIPCTDEEADGFEKIEAALRKANGELSL